MAAGANKNRKRISRIWKEIESFLPSDEILEIKAQSLKYLTNQTWFRRQQLESKFSQ